MQVHKMASFTQICMLTPGRLSGTSAVIEPLKGPVGKMCNRQSAYIQMYQVYDPQVVPVIGKRLCCTSIYGIS